MCSIVLGLVVGYATSLLVHVPKYLRLHISCAIAFGEWVLRCLQLTCDM